MGIRYKIIIVFFTIVFLKSLFINDLSARQDFDIIRDSESKERPQTEEDASKIIVRPNIEYEAEGLRDPFKVYEEEYKKRKEEVAVGKEPIQIEPLPSLTIQGIVWGGSAPLGIINDKVVKVGDTIEGVKIIKIDRDGIKVLYHGREYNLSSPAKISLPR